jgi:hypothetical protein
MYLFISPTGARVWRLAYRFGGVQKTMSFGAYPEVSLASARAARDAAREKLRAVYNRAAYLTDRRAMLEGWGRWLEAQ